MLGFLVIARFRAMGLTTFAASEMTRLTAEMEGGVTAAGCGSNQYRRREARQMYLHMLSIVASPVRSERKVRIYGSRIYHVHSRKLTGNGLIVFFGVLAGSIARMGCTTVVGLVLMRLVEHALKLTCGALSRAESDGISQTLSEVLEVSLQISNICIVCREPR